MYEIIGCKSPMMEKSLDGNYYISTNVVVMQETKKDNVNFMMTLKY